jgi:hypothetical protein
MLIVTREYNAALGQIKRVETEMEVTFRSSVATIADLPTSDNAEGDLRLCLDTDHLFAYVNGVFVDQGAYDMSDLMQERLMQGLS